MCLIDEFYVVHDGPLTALGKGAEHSATQWILAMAVMAVIVIHTAVHCDECFTHHSRGNQTSFKKQINGMKGRKGNYLTDTGRQY